MELDVAEIFLDSRPRERINWIPSVRPVRHLVRDIPVSATGGAL